MGNLSGYQGNFNPFVTKTIANGQTETDALTLNGFVLCGILLPAAFTGTTITFEVASAIGGTYVPLKSTIAGTLLTYTVAPSTYAAIDPKDFHGVQFLKIKSGSAEAAARTLLCALKGF